VSGVSVIVLLLRFDLWPRERYVDVETTRDGMMVANCDCRGYVALAVSSDKGTFTREVETGLGKDRIANMTQFAIEALILLRDVIKGDAKL